MRRITRSCSLIFLTVQELAELGRFGVRRDRCGQSHAKSLRPRPLNALPRFGPSTCSTMLIVALGRRAIEADLQCHPIARQCAQNFQASPDKKHPVGQYGRRGGRRAGRQNVTDVAKQERLAACHENLADSERCCLACDPPHPL